MVAYWTRIWRVRRSQRWGWQRMRETMFEGLGTQPISLVKMWSWECERSSILHKWKPPHRIIVTMTLFTNGRFLRFLITPPLLPRFRRSLLFVSKAVYYTFIEEWIINAYEIIIYALPEQMEPKLTFTCTVSDCGERSTHQFFYLRNAHTRKGPYSYNVQDDRIGMLFS